MWLGVDDTDSTKGGCTTWLATELVRELHNAGFDLIGYPRLVRLNPNIPWKTRGNGAICIRFGKGKGKKSLIGEINGRRYYGYELEERMEENDGWEAVFERSKALVEKYSQFDDLKTNPGLVVAGRKPPAKLYWQALRSIVELKSVKKILRSPKTLHRGYKNQRGLIGATAAIAWRVRDKTYEITAYREPTRWGTERVVDPSSVIAMDKKFLHTFNNYDYENKRVAIAPHSPCPVLFGIRAESPELIGPLSAIKSEKIARWLLFETNQATDEHLQCRSLTNLRPYSSAILSSKVVEEPKTISGGHVFFKLGNSARSIFCAAYEPTKKFRNVIRELKLGDRIVVFGGVREVPFTINLEKLKVESLAESYKKIPLTCKCGKKLESVGKNKGYRCRKCGYKTQEFELVKVSRKLRQGFYEVPVCARRHLSKPLKRILE